MKNCTWLLLSAMTHITMHVSVNCIEHENNMLTYIPLHTQALISRSQFGNENKSYEKCSREKLHVYRSDWLTFPLLQGYVKNSPTMLNYTAVLTNTVHHFLLLEGIKYFLLSTSKSPSSKCCCYSRNFNAAFSLWNSLVVMKSPVLAVAVYPQYMILPCAAKGLQQTYRWNEGSMTRWLSQQLLACCLKTLPQSTILFYVILFIYLPFFSFTDFYRHNSHAICHLWHCSSPGCDPAAN